MKKTIPFKMNLNIYVQQIYKSSAQMKYYSLTSEKFSVSSGVFTTRSFCSLLLTPFMRKQNVQKISTAILEGAH